MPRAILMNVDDVRRLLERRCREAGGQAAFAEAHGFTKAYVSQVVNAQRPPSERLCDVLGIRDDGRRWTRT